jgi:hypothetical protein
MPAIESHGVEETIRPAVIRRCRPDGYGGAVIERAAIVAEGTPAGAIEEWILAQGGEAELPVVAVSSRLYGLRHDADAALSRASTTTLRASRGGAVMSASGSASRGDAAFRAAIAAIAKRNHAAQAEGARRRASRNTTAAREAARLQRSEARDLPQQPGR